MSTPNMLLRMVSFLILLLPLMVSAKNEEQKDKFAEAKQEAKEGDIHVIKLEDILNGKHSGAQKKSDTQTVTTEPVKKQSSGETSKPAQKDEKESQKKPPKVIVEKVEPKLKPKPKPKPKPQPKIEPKAEKKDPKPKVAKQKPESKPESKATSAKVESSSTIQKVANKASNKAPNKAPNKPQELDLLKAYSELMGATDQNRGRAKTVSKSQKVVAKGSAGWLYLGKFSEGEWDKKDKQVLGLNGVLPTINYAYSLRIHSNIRNGYPLKGKMPSIQKVLRAGNKVRVIALHNSGRSGHYWAKVAW